MAEMNPWLTPPTWSSGVPWVRFGDLDRPQRPMVMIDETPWHEMNGDGELTIRSTDPVSRGLETSLRQTLYAWNHVRCDMVVDGPDFVFSRKPNPAMVAMDEWVPELAVKDFEDVLEVTKANGCPVEFTLKDISTCRSDPRRLWEWSEIAMRMVRG
jgi:hypothetical protein